MSDPREAASAIVEEQLKITLERDTFTSAEVQGSLFEIWSALHSEDETVVSEIPALT